MNVLYWAAFSCPHCPFEHPGHVQWMLDTLADLKPRPRLIVCLGDLLDAAPASVHPNEFDHTVAEEYAHGADLLRRVREAVPYRCDYVWMLGNHEDNLQTPDPRRIARPLREAVHWNNDPVASREFRLWRQLPYEKSRTGVLSVGQVNFFHGFDVSQNSDELESLHFAWMLGGHANRLFVRGHTHKPAPLTQCVRTKTCPLPYWYMNVGTLGPLKPHYMRRKSSFMWGPGLAVGEAVADFTPEGGKQWDAELLEPHRES